MKKEFLEILESLEKDIGWLDNLVACYVCPPGYSEGKDDPFTKIKKLKDLVCKTDWIPTSSELPPEGEIVQVTYVGIDNEIYCDAFAYVLHGDYWYWAQDEISVRTNIVAWRHNCEPYKVE